MYKAIVGNVILKIVRRRPHVRKMLYNGNSDQYNPNEASVGSQEVSVHSFGS